MVCKSTLIELNKGFLLIVMANALKKFLQFDVFAGGLVHMISVVGLLLPPKKHVQADGGKGVGSIQKKAPITMCMYFICGLTLAKLTFIRCETTLCV